MSTQRTTGVVKWYSPVLRGYGFVATSEGDAFLHSDDVPSGLVLHAGDNVVGDVMITHKGLKIVNISKKE